jgi:hypothetical protein
LSNIEEKKRTDLESLIKNADTYEEIRSLVGSITITGKLKKSNNHDSFILVLGSGCINCVQTTVEINKKDVLHHEALSKSADGETILRVNVSRDAVINTASALRAEDFNLEQITQRSSQVLPRFVSSPAYFPRRVRASPTILPTSRRSRTFDNPPGVIPDIEPRYEITNEPDVNVLKIIGSGWTPGSVVAIYRGSPPLAGAGDQGPVNNITATADQQGNFFAQGYLDCDPSVSAFGPYPTIFAHSSDGLYSPARPAVAYVCGLG